MLKIYDYAITFSEFPDDIALCVNISNCPNKCLHCSESYLCEDIGTPATPEFLKEITDKYSYATLFGIMGGDSDFDDRIRIAKWIKENTNMKVGIYSGKDYISLKGIEYIDYYKIGRWIYPFDSNDNLIIDKQCGPINYVGTNQKIFKVENNMLIDITYKMQKKLVNDIRRFVLNEIPQKS